MEEKETKKEKHFIKKWWFGILFLLIILAIILVFTFMNDQAGGVGTAGISKEEFEKIEIGMDNFEVNSIIDELDEWKNDEIYEKVCEEIERTKKESIYTYTYKYAGEKAGYALITFEVDYSEGVFGLKYPEVTKKENHNLK